MSDVNQIETAERMIIFALEGRSNYAKNVVVGGGFSDRRRGMSCVQLDAGDRLGFCDMYPESMYALGLDLDDDRFFTTDKDLLLRHPVDIIRDRAELSYISNNAMNWIGMRRSKHVAGVYALRSACYWYEFHFRSIFLNGTSNYMKRVVAFTESGDVSSVMTKSGNLVVCSKAEASTAILLASAIEDAHRPKTMLATVAGEGEIKFAVPLDDYQSMFIGRDAPMKNGRRKAIIHWVASHLRRKKDGGSTTVKKHVRGVDQIEIDGLRISIHPNDEVAA